MVYLSICQGYNPRTRLQPKKILKLEKMDKESAQERGAPTGKDWDDIFGTECAQVFGIYFEKVEPHEVPADQALMQKSAATLDTLRNAGPKGNMSAGKEKVLEFSELFKPDESRTVKSKAQLEEEKLREIQFPSNLLKRFIEHAFNHSPNEYMAWILGTHQEDSKTKKSISYAGGLYFPMQDSNMTSVWEAGGSVGEKLQKHLEDTGMVVVGWIHSHPTFEAFFSSTDAHMMYYLQQLCPMAYGLVVDSDKKLRCMRLSPEGIKAVCECKHEQWQAPRSNRRYTKSKIKFGQAERLYVGSTGVWRQPSPYKIIGDI